MKVTFELPNAVWVKLAAIADEHDIKVGEWLADEVEAIVINVSEGRRVRIRRTPKGANPYACYRPVTDEGKRARIRDLRGLGWSLPEISRHVGVSRQIVGATLWDLGLDTKAATAANNERKAS